MGDGVSTREPARGERQSAPMDGAREELLRQILESSREGIWRIDADAKTTFANGALASMLGYEPSEMLGKAVSDFLDPEGRRSLAAGIERRRQGIADVRDAKLIKRDGSVLWAIVHASPLFEAGAYVGALAMITDNTARRKAEDALRASEERYRLLFDGSPLPKWLTDVETLSLLAVNDAACALWGYSKQELSTMSMRDILLPADLAASLQLAATTSPGQTLKGTFRHRRKDATLLDVDMFAHTFTLDGRQVRLVVGQDVTARGRLEAQLMQAQKMEAIGLLAGGVAHDFNNLLYVISTYSSFMLDALQPGDPLRDDVSEVAKASERATALTRQLLTFSRQQVLQPRIMDLNETVAGIQGMLQRVAGPAIELCFVKCDGLGRVNADPGQIEQLVMNLTVNARDAMPDGGSLTIETANEWLGEVYAAEHPGLVPGRYVTLKVTDTGVGMSPEVSQRIFEPFFTTKEAGKGTGLGLPSVLGITQQSGGAVAFHSAIGRGTTFKIHLPRVDGALAISEPPPSSSIAAQGSETILLVEDDDQVRHLVRAILRRYGYPVLDASNGGEAFLVCEQHPGPIGLLLTDVNMPKMSGLQLAERLSLMRPDMKVLFMSGHSGDAALQRRVLEAGRVLLQKPIRPEDLARHVREALGTTAPAGRSAAPARRHERL